MCAVRRSINYARVAGFLTLRINLFALTGSSDKAQLLLPPTTGRSLNLSLKVFSEVFFGSFPLSVPFILLLLLHWFPVSKRFYKWLYLWTSLCSFPLSVALERSHIHNTSIFGPQSFRLPETESSHLSHPYTKHLIQPCDVGSINVYNGPLLLCPGIHECIRRRVRRHTNT